MLNERGKIFVCRKLWKLVQLDKNAFWFHYTLMISFVTESQDHHQGSLTDQRLRRPITCPIPSIPGTI